MYVPSLKDWKISHIFMYLPLVQENAAAVAGSCGTFWQAMRLNIVLKYITKIFTFTVG